MLRSHWPLHRDTNRLLSEVLSEHLGLWLSNGAKNVKEVTPHVPKDHTLLP